MTRPPHSAPIAYPNRVLPVLLLALALVFAQLLLGAHQTEHLAAGETGHDCPLCLTGNGLDQAPAAEAAPAPPEAPVARTPIPRSGPSATAARSAYRVRAPPVEASTA